MLRTKQITGLDAAKLDIQNKKLILETAIDIQALLRILVNKEIITKQEVDQYRAEVRGCQKYRAALVYIDQTLKEIEMYENDPTLQLKELLNRKMQEM